MGLTDGTRREAVLAGAGLDEQFVARQRERLLQMRDELRRLQEGAREEERSLGEEEGDTELDSGDESQHMYTREMDATVAEQAGRRLEDVERALQKIEDGTYGLSDESGEEIPAGRLEAAPEAVRTVEEQQRFER